MSRQGPFGWFRGQRPADAAKIKRSSSADRFSWRPGERVDDPPRRRAQEAAGDRAGAKNMRAPDGR